MPPYRIVKKNIAKEKEFNTAIDLSAYGVTDVNDTNQLRAFVTSNANSKDPLISRSVEYTRYRIAALQEIDKRSQKLTNQRTGKLSKVIFTGKEVDKVEGHPDVTDCFIMDNINQEEKQTSANGCWSVSMSLLLQSRGVDIDQQMIRAFKPTGDASYYNDNPMAVEDYMHLIEKVSPNTGLRSRMITSKENFAHLSNIEKTSDEYRDGVAHVADNLKKVVDESLRRSNSPVSITDNNHFLTVVGTGKKDGKDGFFYKDSLGPEEPNKTYFKTYEEYVNEKLANPIPENALKSIRCTFLQDYDITKEKDSNVKTCDQIVGFPGIKFEDGKIKPAEKVEDGKEGDGSIKEDDETFLIIDPAESEATKDNTVAIATDGDVTETIYFPSKVLDGTPYLSVEATQQEMAAEEEFEKPASSALLRSDTYSDYMRNVSRQLDSEPLFKRADLPVDPELENKFGKLSHGDALIEAMSYLRDLKGNFENLKGLLSGNQPSPRAEEASDSGLTNAVKAAADCINLFLENTTESKDSEFYGQMERLHNKLNGLAAEKAAVDAELEMYKNAYVLEHDVTLTNDLDKDIDAARLNVANWGFVLSETEPELEKAKQEYIKAVEAEEAEERQLKAEEEQRKSAENQGEAAKKTVDIDKENERLDKAIEESTNALHEHFKTLDAIEARLGVTLRERSAFTKDGQDINDLAATNPFTSEVSADEREKLGKDRLELNNKIDQEFDKLRNLQSEKSELNKNQNLEDANALVNAPVNDSSNVPIEDSKDDEAQPIVRMVSHNGSRTALWNYNNVNKQVATFSKNLEEAQKHLDTLLATKKSIDLKKEALAKRNDALVRTSEGLLGLSEGLERVERKFPFFKVGRNKNSEEFQNLHDKIWEVQNKLTPNLSSEENSNREADKNYVLGDQFRDDLQDLRESAQNYVSHIESLNAEKGKEGPSSEVGKRRLALANNVISFCDQMSQSFEKKDSLEKLNGNDITRKADRNIGPHNLKNDFSNDEIESQKRARNEKAQREANKSKSLLDIILELLGLKKKTPEMVQDEKAPSEQPQNEKSQNEKSQNEMEPIEKEQAKEAQAEMAPAESEQAKETQAQKEPAKEEAAKEAQAPKEPAKEEPAKEAQAPKAQVQQAQNEQVQAQQAQNEQVQAQQAQNNEVAQTEVKEEVKKEANKQEEKKEVKKEANKEEEKTAAKVSTLETIIEADVEDEQEDELEDGMKDGILVGLNKHKSLPYDELDEENSGEEIPDSILEDLEKPKMTEAQADAEMKKLGKEVGLDDNEDEKDASEFDENEKQEELTEEQLNAKLKALENEPEDENLFDQMINNNKSYDNNFKNYVNQQEARSNDANRGANNVANSEVNKEANEANKSNQPAANQSNPVAQGVNKVNAPEQKNNAEASKQQKAPEKNNKDKKAIDNDWVVIDERTGAPKQLINANELTNMNGNIGNRKRKELNANQRNYIAALKTQSASRKDVKKQLESLKQKKTESFNKRHGIAQQTKKANLILNKGKNSTTENKGPEMGTH